MTGDDIMGISGLATVPSVTRGGTHQFIQPKLMKRMRHTGSSRLVEGDRNIKKHKLQHTVKTLENGVELSLRSGRYTVQVFSGGGERQAGGDCMQRK